MLAPHRKARRRDPPQRLESYTFCLETAVQERGMKRLTFLLQRNNSNNYSTQISSSMTSNTRVLFQGVDGHRRQKYRVLRIAVKEMP